MNLIREAEELMSLAKELGIGMRLLEQSDAERLTKTTLEVFTPFKISGHLGIGKNSIELPIDRWEFSYMDYLPQEVGYIFFEQNSELKGKTVLEIENLKLLGKILIKTSGMEYFLTNQDMNFLIAVNWYVIEIAGVVEEQMKKLLDL